MNESPTPAKPNKNNAYILLFIGCVMGYGIAKLDTLKITVKHGTPVVAATQPTTQAATQPEIQPETQPASQPTTQP